MNILCAIALTIWVVPASALMLSASIQAANAYRGSGRILLEGFCMALFWPGAAAAGRIQSLTHVNQRPSFVWYAIAYLFYPGKLLVDSWN